MLGKIVTLEGAEKVYKETGFAVTVNDGKNVNFEREEKKSCANSSTQSLKNNSIIIRVFAYFF